MVRIILLAALILRIAAAFVWQDKVGAEQRLFLFGDSQTYWILAEKIANGEPYDYAGPNSRVFRAPLYPLFLAPATLLEGRTAVLIARIAGSVMGTAAVGLVMLSTYRIAGRKAALYAGTLAAIYPGAIGMSVFILSESIFCPLCLLCLLAWSQADKQNRPLGWIVVSGVASGLACLARPSWFLWPVLLAFLSIFVRRSESTNDLLLQRSVGQGIIRLVVFGLAMSATMSPWWLRNYQITGQLVPTTLQVGPSLFDGLHPGASGSSDEGMAFSIPFENELRQEDTKTAEDAATPSDREAAIQTCQKTFEWRLNQRMLTAAIRWANENRSDTLWLALLKFGKTWSPWPTAKELGGVWIRVAESVAYVVIMALAAIALWSVSQYRRCMILFVSPTIYFAALHMIFVGSVRYRQPAVLVLCVVAGIGAAWMLERNKDQTSPNQTRRL